MVNVLEIALTCNHYNFCSLAIIMQKLSRTEKMWLIFFALVLAGLIGGCMYETVTNHKPLGPRPIIKEQDQP
jgi:hypothetical protein